MWEIRVLFSGSFLQVFARFHWEQADQRLRGTRAEEEEQPKFRSFSFGLDLLRGAPVLTEPSNRCCL
jgi:hypothetical protein